MITPEDNYPIIYPSEGDNSIKEYSLRILIANPAGGWHWRNILIKAPHIFKLQFGDAREVPGFNHSLTLDASQP